MLRAQLRHTTACAFIIAATLAAPAAYAQDMEAGAVAEPSVVAGPAEDNGMIVVTAFISPYRADRDHVRTIAGTLFHEVHVKADVATCELRDPKGLYKKARAGEIKDFTGISAPYEPPEAPELVVDTANQSIEQSVSELLAYVATHFQLTTKAVAAR